MLDHAYLPTTWLPYILIFTNFLSAIAWPAALLVVSLVFRVEIRQLIQNIRKVKAPGIEIGIEGKQELPGGDEEAYQIKPEPFNPNILRTNPMIKIEDTLRADLSNVPANQREAQLLTALALSRLESAFGVAYANIFGSQIRSLRLLADRHGGITLNEAQALFVELQSQHSVFADWTLNQYLNFLRFYQFIDEANGMISITDFGREFLVFLIRRGLSEDRLH